jgi:hypothetical protein
VKILGKFSMIQIKSLSIIQKYATLLVVDEYKTSQMCSCCRKGVIIEKSGVAKENDKDED